MGGKCSASFRLVWDPGIIISFSLVQFVVPMGVMALLEEMQSLGRENYHVPIFGFPCFSVRDGFRDLSVKKKGVRGFI